MVPQPGRGGGGVGGWGNGGRLGLRILNAIAQ